jgi:hypothetical protein
VYGKCSWHNANLITNADQGKIMTQSLSRQVFANAGVCNRAGDRRLCKNVPPPYRTIDGLVTVDRRSLLDRRSSWLREYSLDLNG